MNGKSYTASWRIVAAVMAALLGACSTGTEPNPNSRLAIFIVEPTAEVVNRTTPPDTRVRLRARVEGASNAQVRWLVGGVEVCATLACMNTFSPGTHTLKVEARSGANTATATATVENPPRSITVMAVFFPDGATEFRADEAVPCPTIEAEQPPARTEPTERSLSVNGTPAECMDGTLVPPTRQPTAPLSVAEEGSYTLRAEVCIAGTSVCDTGEVTFRVTEAPPQVVFGNSSAGDFYTVDLVRGEAEAERLTSDGAPKSFPNIHPNGTRLVYASEEREDRHETCFIYVRDLQTGSIVEYAYEQANGCRAPVWSPDGSRIAFTGTYEDPDFSWYQSVFVINADGTGFRVVSVRECDEGWINAPCSAGSTGSSVVWHPEGLIFSRKEAVTRLDIREYVALVDVETGVDIRRLFEDEVNAQTGLDVYGISPDRQIVVVNIGLVDTIRTVRTDGSGTIGVFQAQQQAFFCGDSEWVYYPTKVESGDIVFRRVRPNGNNDQPYTTLTGIGQMWIPRCIPLQ